MLKGSDFHGQSVTRGRRGTKNRLKKRDVIYGRPPTAAFGVAQQPLWHSIGAGVRRKIGTRSRPISLSRRRRVAMVRTQEWATRASAARDGHPAGRQWDARAPDRGHNATTTGAPSPLSHLNDTQCAAVSTHSSLMRAPPQRFKPKYLTATCHGQLCGRASNPPKMRPCQSLGA